MSLVDEGSLESSVSNGAPQCVGRNAPALIDMGTHETELITHHLIGPQCHAQGIGGIQYATAYITCSLEESASCFLLRCGIPMFHTNNTENFLIR